MVLFGNPLLHNNNNNEIYFIERLFSNQFNLSMKGAVVG
jgi:hypothetical protein